MKKIGIMGGTFNPIHNAHIMMAQAAYEQYELDEVWFMPSKNPPHKEKQNIASDEHRKRMVQHAIDNIPHFSFSDIELKREGITYTCETLQEIYAKNSDIEIYFILGGDSLASFGKWYKPKTIMKYCKILAAPRGDLSDEDMKSLCKKQGKEFHGDFLPITMNHIQISSEQIRERIKNGKSAYAFCPESVVRYIQIHELYGSKKWNYKCKNVDKDLLACLSATLRPKRYIHTLGVANTAANLAFCHMDESDVKRAELAGMLHDCAKYYTGEEMISLCKEYGIKLSETEMENTALIHSKLGSYLVKYRYGVKDDEICSAISYHTTGKPDMTTMEKIIYIADYIEPMRKMDCKPHALEEIRKECFRNLDSGLFMILENTVFYLQNSDMKIDEMSLETYEYYKNRKAD